jgi:hypothetical protein
MATLSKLIQVRVTSAMEIEVKRTAKRLGLRPADVLRAAIALGLSGMADKRGDSAK